MQTTARPTWDSTDFLMRFLVSAVSVVVLLAIAAPLRDALVSFTIWMIAASARSVGLVSTVGEDGLMLFSSATGGAFAYRVVEECAAAAVVGLFVTAVLALPGVQWSRRAVGAAVGAVFIIAINWMRLLNLAWIGVHHPRYFDVAHVWLWQGIGIGIVVGGWIVWARWAGAASPTNLRGPASLRWFGAVVALGALLTVTQVSAMYSTAVDALVRAMQGAITALPYGTLTWPTTASDEWDVQVRSVALVLAMALTAALTGPRASGRLRAMATAGPLVFLAQALGQMVGDASEARFGSEAAIPALVIVQALPILVPITLGYRSFAGRSTEDEDGREGTDIPTATHAASR